MYKLSLLVAGVRLQTGADYLIGNLHSITLVTRLKNNDIVLAPLVLDLEAIALDVEPTLTHVNRLDAAEVLHALQVGLDLVGDMILVARADLIDMELIDNRISSIASVNPIGTDIETGDIILIQLVHGAVVGADLTLHDVLMVPQVQVVEGLVDVTQEEVSLGAEQEGFLTGELVTYHVHIADTGNLVGVLKLLPAVAAQDITVAVTAIKVATETGHQTAPGGT